MTAREKKLIKYKKQHLYLVNKINRLQLSGKNPPEKLLKQVKEVAQASEILETSLKSIFP